MPRNRSKGSRRAVVEDGLARGGVQRGDPAVPHELDPPLGELRQDRLGRRGRRRDRRAERDHDLDPDGVADTVRAQQLVEQERRLARRRRALERRAADADDRGARSERREQVADGLGARHRVELVAGLGQARRGREVVVGTERHHQDVRLVGAAIGRDAPPVGVDRGDGLLQEPDVRRRDLSVGQAHRRRGLLPEHHVQLREAEHERVGAIDQGDLDLVAQLLRAAGSRARGRRSLRRARARWWSWGEG